MSNHKITVFIDMDDVLADFAKGVGREDHEVAPPEMYKEGFFRNLEVLPGAKEAISSLLKNRHLDLYIATKPVTNKFCPSEKYEWIGEHFPELLEKMFLVCDKGKLDGHYLIDDNADQWADVFQGEFLHFDTHNPKQSWFEIVEYFKEITE